MNLLIELVRVFRNILMEDFQSLVLIKHLQIHLQQIQVLLLRVRQILQRHELLLE